MITISSYKYIVAEFWIFNLNSELKGKFSLPRIIIYTKKKMNCKITFFTFKKYFMSKQKSL